MFLLLKSPMTTERSGRSLEWRWVMFFASATYADLGLGGKGEVGM